MTSTVLPRGTVRIRTPAVFLAPVVNSFWLFITTHLRVPFTSIVINRTCTHKFQGLTSLDYLVHYSASCRNTRKPCLKRCGHPTDTPRLVTTDTRLCSAQDLLLAVFTRKFPFLSPPALSRPVSGLLLAQLRPHTQMSFTGSMANQNSKLHASKPLFKTLDINTLSKDDVIIACVKSFILQLVVLITLTVFCSIMGATGAGKSSVRHFFGVPTWIMR